MFRSQGGGARVFFGALPLLLIAAACGGSSSGDTGGDLSGEIVVSGSSTVEPITSLAAEAFQGQNPDVSISVDGPGTGDGFELFCNGDTDVSDASRPIKLDEEAPVCEKNGVEFIEIKVAIDGISVITSPDNSDVSCLDYKDLYALLGPESKGFKTWSDANELAAKLGAANAPYPDVPLAVTAPGEESGTYDSFAELVLADTTEEQGLSEDQAVPRPDYQSSPNDNVIITGVADTSSFLGWVGYAFYQQNEDNVKALEVDGGEGCVAPTEETLADGSYPISRDLFIYVNKKSAEENQALAAFIDFYVSEEGLTAVADAGYVNQPSEEMDASIAAWESKEAGSREEEG